MTAFASGNVVRVTQLPKGNTNAAYKQIGRSPNLQIGDLFIVSQYRKGSHTVTYNSWDASGCRHPQTIDADSVEYAQRSDLVDYGRLAETRKPRKYVVLRNSTRCASEYRRGTLATGEIIRVSDYTDNGYSCIYTTHKNWRQTIPLHDLLPLSVILNTRDSSSESSSNSMVKSIMAEEDSKFLAAINQTAEQLNMQGKATFVTAKVIQKLKDTLNTVEKKNDASKDAQAAACAACVTKLNEALSGAATITQTSAEFEYHAIDTQPITNMIQLLELTNGDTIELGAAALQALFDLSTHAPAPHVQHLQWRTAALVK